MLGKALSHAPPDAGLRNPPSRRLPSNPLPLESEACGRVDTGQVVANSLSSFMSEPKSPDTVYFCCMKACCPSSLPRLIASQT